MPFPNKITTNGDLLFGGEAPAFMAPPNPVFEPTPNSNVRYTPEPDMNVLNIRMCKSTDKGVTWAEQDAANAPLMPADGSGGTGFIQVYEFINACMDPASKIIYTCYFDPASFNIALAPFDTKTDKWLPFIISTLSYLPTAANQFFNSGSFVTVFRPNDRAVWVWFYGGGADANDVATVWGAKCLVTAAGTGTWDLALTRFAGTLHDGIEWSQGGGGVDNAGNIHYWALRHYSGFGATAHTTQHADGLGNKIIDSLVLDTGGAGYKAGTVTMTVFVAGVGNFFGSANIAVDGGPVVSLNVPPGLIGTVYLAIQPDPTVGINKSSNNSDLMHYVLHPDDSFAGPQFVLHDSFQIIFPAAINCTPDGVLLSSCTTGSNVGGPRHLLRALAADAPAWEDLSPASIQEPNVASLIGLVHRALDGLDYAVFAIKNAGNGNTDYFYATSPGIGKPFGTPVLIGSVLAADPNGNGKTLVASIFDDLGLTFPYGSGAGFPAIGMGFFEIGLPVAPPILTLTFKGYKVYPR